MSIVADEFSRYSCSLAALLSLLWICCPLRLYISSLITSPVMRQQATASPGDSLANGQKCITHKKNLKMEDALDPISISDFCAGLP